MSVLKSRNALPLGGSNHVVVECLWPHQRLSPRTALGVQCRPASRSTIRIELLKEFCDTPQANDLLTRCSQAQLALQKQRVVKVVFQEGSQPRSSFHDLLMSPNNKCDLRCILCHRPLRRIGEDFTGKPIYKCHNCQYVCTTISTAAETAALYDDPEYFDGWGCNLDFDYDRFEPSVHQQVDDYLDFIAAHTHQGKSLLDVGT